MSFKFYFPSSLLIVMSTDLQAALDSEPDNPEAKALLHHRSVTVEKVCSGDQNSHHTIH